MINGLQSKLLFLIILCALVFFVMISFGQNEKNIVLELNEDNFQNEVLESDKLVVIDFWAVWCKHCKTLSPIIERLARFNQKYNKDKIKWFRVDVDENRKFLNRFRPFRGLPVVVFYKDGKEIYRFIGILPSVKIQGIINFLLEENKINDSWIKIFFLVYSCIVVLAIGINSRYYAKHSRRVKNGREGKS